MSFQQTKDLLAQIKSYHQSIRQQYDTLRKGTEDEAMKRLLDELVAAEIDIEDGIVRYLESGDEDVLDTWFKSPPDAAQLFQELEHAPKKNTPTVSKLMVFYRKYNDELVSFLDRLANISLSERARTLFANLRDLHVERQKEIAWQVVRS